MRNMKLDEENFNWLLELLRKIPNTVYDQQAKIFAGREGTEYPPFEERDGNSIDSYPLYCTIGGKTLPLEKGIILSAFIRDGVTEEDRRQLINRDQCCSMFDYVGFLNRPLEVLAVEVPGKKEGIRDKWAIYLLRRPDTGQGYIHDGVVRRLTQ
jgi:hypothetical protein